MNQIKLFIQQKNIVINDLSLNFNDIKDIKEKTKLINFKNIQEGIYLFQENIYYLEEDCRTNMSTVRRGCVTT